MGNELPGAATELQDMNPKSSAVAELALGAQRPSTSDFALILGDALVAGVIAPIAAVLFVGRTRSYIGQMWLLLVGAMDLPVEAEALAEGGWLAACCVLGVLCTGSYGEAAVDPKDLLSTLRQTWRAAGVSGALLLCSAGVGVVGLLLPAMPSTVAAGLVNNVTSDLIVDMFLQATCLVGWRFACAIAQAEVPGSPKSIIDRVLRPEIADQGLVVGDVFVSGVVVPAIVVLFLVQTDSYIPEWMVSGGLLERGVGAPALAHGAALASCWIAGAILTGAFEAEAVYSRDLAINLKVTSVAGAVASVVLAGLTVGCLVLAEGPSSVDILDFEVYRRVGRSFVDLILDFLLGAGCLTAWRLQWAGFL